MKRRGTHLFVYTEDHRIPKWVPLGLLRYAAAIGVIVLPLIFLSVFILTVHPRQLSPVSIPDFALVSGMCHTGQQLPSSDLVSIEIQGSDVSGRYLFAVPSAALRFISIIAAIFAMFVIFRRTTLLIGTIFTATAFAVGLLLATMLHDQGATRKTLVAPIAKAAANASLTGAGLEEYIESSVHLNGLFGITATFVVLCGLSVVAIRARDEELTPAILRQRLFDLRWSMILAAAVLALVVIITRSLVEWHLGFLCTQFADKLRPVGLAIAIYWGAGASGFLLAAFLPTYFSWIRDVVRRTNLAKPKSTEKERRLLIEQECLDFSPATSATTLLTIGMPALSGPMLELIKGLTGKVG